MSVKLLTEHHLEFLSLKRGCTGSSESTLVKMPHCWKSHVADHNAVTPVVHDSVTIILLLFDQNTTVAESSHVIRILITVFTFFYLGRYIVSCF